MTSHPTAFFRQSLRYVVLVLATLGFGMSISMFPLIAAASMRAQEGQPPAEQRELVFLKGWSSLKIEISSDIAWGDVDGDGDLDLAVGNYGDPTRVYRNHGGGLDIQPIWSTSESAHTKSVAWGDVDSDGDLDLAVGNYGSPTRVYKNQGGTLDTQPFWSTVKLADTNSVAWGDVDGDGDLDLAIGNTDSPTQVYRNQNGILDTEPIWWTDESVDTQSVAWGDVDGDGDLDLAVGNYGSPSRVYENRGGMLTQSIWNTTESAGAFSVAWGDMDGDGDLDLAIGNNGSPSRVYENRDGMLNTAWVWSTNESVRAESVAWGDVDGDGDLDLAVGIYGGLTCIYRNHEGKLDVHAIWSLGKPADTTSVAWGDVDGDGDLDLAIGNTNDPTWVYNNPYGALGLEPSWQADQPDDTRSIALGDVDGDGDLDLAVGNYRSPTKVYQNHGGILDIQPSWRTDKSDDVRSVAWGDVDGDGDLDLAVGSDGGSPTRVYKNLGGALDTQPAWSTYESVGTKGVVWGDVDGDGDLDLALANWGHPTQVYENQGGVLDTRPIWSTEESVHSNSVAWGDMDNDGDLDLAVGNSSSPTRIYINRGGMLDTQPAWSTDESAYTQSIAWGDVDGDGDLDLAVGNDSGPTRVYENHSGELNALPMWSTDESDHIRSVAWGDMDGDGDLDLAVGNKSGSNKVYQNQDGVLQPSFAWKTSDPSDQTLSVAWGDIDGDGNIDLVVGNSQQPSKVYRNSRPAHPFAAGQPPETIVVHTNYYTSPLVRSGVIPITYTLHHPLSETMRSVKAMFSLDGGGHWQEAKPVTDITSNADLVTVTLPYPQVAVTNTHVFNWDVNASGFFGQSDNVVVRLVAYPSLKPRKNGIPGPLQRPFVSTQTYPFRVRGNQVKVITDTVTVGNTDAVVYRLPAGKERGAEPLGGGQPFRTSSNGFLQGRAEMTVNPDEQKSDRLVAVWPSAYVTRTVPTQSYINALPITVTAKSTIASGLVISDARRIADIGMWVNISATLPVTLQAHLMPPRGDLLHIISDTVPLSATLLVFEDEKGDAQAGCEAQIGACSLFAEKLAGLRGMLADGAWTLQVANPTTRPMQLLDWGLNLQLSPLHFTSAKPFATGLDSYAVTTGGVQTLTVSSKNPLLLFDLNVALEWNAINDEYYQTQLSADLRRASELLYDWTNGQVVLGNMRVYHDARRNTLPDGTNAWNNAHIRIYASNRLRPNADQGGIISEPFAETVQLSNMPKSIGYLPGQVRMGAAWNRYGDATAGNLGDDWPAAFAHELGHYLLFLDDNYLTLQGNLLAPLRDDDCQGAMNNPYSNVYSEFHPAQGWKTTKCKESLSELNTGRSDWETIKHFYSEVITPTGIFSDVLSGPSLLPLAVTQVRYQAPDPGSDPLSYLAHLYGAPDETPEMVYNRLCGLDQGGIHMVNLPEQAEIRAPDLPDRLDRSAPPPALECRAPITSTQPLEVPIFYLKGVEQDSPSRGQARAFLFQGPPHPTVLDLGQPIGDQMIALGARPGDRLCVYDLPNGRVGCEAILAGDDQLALEKPIGWEPEIVISPDATSHFLTVIINLPDIHENRALALTARLYPMDGPAPAAAAMSLVACTNDRCEYQTTLVSDSPVLEGYLLVGESQDTPGAVGTNPRQAVTEFAIGGNPVRIRALLSPTEARDVRIRALLAPREMRNEGLRSRRVRIRALLAPAASTDGQVMVYPDETILKPDMEWSFTLQPATRLPAQLPWATPVGRAYWLTASDNIKELGLGQSSITFEYLRSDVPAGEEAFVRMYFWEKETAEKCPHKQMPCWRLLENQESHPEYNLISARLQGPGLYALFSHYELPLQPGWNLIGYPVQTANVPTATRPISLVLASIAGDYSIVYGYDAADMRDPWKLYTPQYNVQSDLAALDFGRGYWLCVTATQPITLHLRGSFPDLGAEKPSATPVFPAGTLPGRQPVTFYGHVTPSASFAPKAGLKVVAKVDGKECGQGQTYADSQGIAYQITLEGNAPDGVNRCGQGSKFVFYVDGRAMAMKTALSQCGIEVVDLAPASAR